MINYNEKFISSDMFKLCLSFNPIEFYLDNKTNFNSNLSIIKSNNSFNEDLIKKVNTLKNLESNDVNLIKLSLEKLNLYYNCSYNCINSFDKINQLPIIKYNYYRDCVCIKKCYDSSF